MERLDEWCSTGKIAYDDVRAPRAGPGLARGRRRSPTSVLDEIRRKRILALMLGDTSMGMINGYFGPRLLYPIGFSEHKVDQAWLIDRGAVDRPTSGSTTPSRSSRTKGVTFHWGEPEAEDFTPEATTRPSSAATWPSSTCSTSSRPTAWAGNTSSAC